MSLHRFAALAAVAVCTLVVPVQAEPPATAPADAEGATAVDADAEKVLRAFGDAVKGAESLSLRIEVDQKLEIPSRGVKQAQVVKQTVQYVHPNRFLLTVEPANAGPQVISDGKRITLYSSTFGKYLQDDAPERLTKEETLARAGGVGSQILMIAAADDPYDVMVDESTQAKYLGEEEIDGEKMQKIRVTEGMVDMDMWFDEKSLMRRMQPDLTRQMQGRDVGDMTMSVVITINDWKKGEAIPDETFAFTPPEGAEQVESVQAVFGGPDMPDPSRRLRGKPAPPVNLDTLDGGKLELASLKGKVVILDFWATWCPPCVASLPILVEVAGEYADKGVVFYAVNVGEEEGEINAFMQQHGLAMNVALDKDRKASDAYMANAIPQTVIVGADGNVHAVHVGAGRDLKEKLTRDLDAALKKAAEQPAAE
jgi:peroxiredoxin